MRSRQIALMAIFGLILCVFVYKWIAGWGQITLHFNDAPVSDVIRSIERQGGVKIASNLPATTPVTIHLDRVSLREALESLSGYTDADLRLAYIGAPDDAKIKEVLTAFSANTNPGGWTAFGGGFGGGGGWGGFTSAGADTDPRRLEWSLSAGNDRNLQTFLTQGAQKTGVVFAVPSEWNPTLGALPAKDSVQKMSKALFSSAKGKVQEVFLLTASPQRDPDQPRAAGDNASYRTVFSPQRGGRGNNDQSGGRRNMNPEWMAERAQAEINQLPPDQRGEAQRLFDEMRALFASTRELPPEERRAKMEEFFQRDDVQTMVQERMMDRDMSRGPQKRQERYRRYIQNRANNGNL